MKTPILSEDAISQLPALHLLQNLGWQYLKPDEALDLRGGKLSNVLLEGVLVPWLREHNLVRFKGKELPFTEGNILSALQALKEIPFDGLVRINEKNYDLLCLGKSLQQSVDGDIKSFTLHYIDWEHPENNVFHVTEEFTVERTGSHQTRRPDIVLFVNGVPFCVIECKSPHIKDPIREAISQQIRNQKDDEIPHLFLYSQLLLALSKNEAKYATTGTPLKFWSVWREEGASLEQELQRLVSISLTEEQVDRLFTENEWMVREKPADYGTFKRQVTEQDRALYALCRPERLLELTYRFILFDMKDIVLWMFPVDVVQGKTLDIAVHRLLQTLSQAKKIVNLLIYTHQPVKRNLFQCLQCAQNIALGKRQLLTLEPDQIVFPQPGDKNTLQEHIGQFAATKVKRLIRFQILPSQILKQVQGGELGDGVFA